MTFLQCLHGSRPAPHQLLYVCVALIVTLMLSSNGSQGCFLQQTAKNYGKTYPAGDIIVHAGDALDLYCTIDLEKAKEINCTVENLVFYKDLTRVDARYQTRVNETTIRLYMENQTESEIMYYCYLERNQSSDSSQLNSLEVPLGTAADRRPLQEMVCMNWVSVGMEPRDVSNFSCVSLNWQALNCSWVVPKNYVKTTYRIQISSRHRYAENKSCPTEDDVNHSFCTWTLRSSPIYRKNPEIFYFYINGTNKFKSNVQMFPFSHFKHIILDPPKELKPVTRNTTSITLQWDIGDLQYFPQPLIYKVLYVNNNSSEWDMAFCGSKNSTRNGSKVTCTITGLVCNKLYNFRVFTKSSVAHDRYWGNFTYTLLRTSVSRPAHSPFTDVGSFQIEPNNGANPLSRTVFVYWQPLDVAEQCGDNFKYETAAFMVGDDGIERNATDVKFIDAVGSYAKFEVGASKYRFEILAVNKEGAAPDVSSVIVPAATEELERCSSFTVTDYLKQDNCANLYELSWEPPMTGPPVDNYTVFWCQSDKERPYQCHGQLQWKTVSSTMLKDDICMDSRDTYQFAISANAGQSSSGMWWAICSVPHDHLGVVRHVYATSTSLTHIEVGWKLDCADQASTIKGFAVTYCVVAGPTATTCEPGTNRTENWNSTHLTKGNLTMLQPYTHYKVTICMYNAEKEGQSSTPVVLHTAEGAPNVKDMKLNLTNRTNTSVIIGWNSPRPMNGELRHYLVMWRQQQPQELRVTTTQVEITNLNPYTKYNVTVKACTSVCSLEVGPIEVSTGIGKPGKVETISVEQQDQGTLVKWDPPSQLGGPRPSYEVHLLKDNVESQVNQTNNTYMLLSKPDCSAEHNVKYEVRVRAINKDDKRDAMEAGAGAQSPVIYEGDKSPAYLLTCSTDGVGMLWRILMWTTFPVLLMVFVGYGSRQLFFRCRDMKDVSFQIPMKFLPCSPDSKGEDPFAPNYAQVVPPRHADEFSTLVDRTVEQSV